MYVWPTAVSGNAEREVQFSSELQFIPEMKMALCLIRDFESRKQGRHTCGARKNVFRVLSECPTALSKQMYWISALYCCLVAQHPK